MNYGIRTVVYPVTDLAGAKAMFHKLLGVKPYADDPYYVGFRVEGQDIGLDPYGHKAGMTVNVCCCDFWHPFHPGAFALRVGLALGI